MPSIFSKIIAGQIPSYKIYEDDLCYAFLDISPIQDGHTLLIPKIEIATFEELDDTLRNHLFKTAQSLSKAIRYAMGSERVGLLVHGLGVKEHFHLHLIPINKADDMDSKNTHELEAEKMQAIQAKIISKLS